MLLQEVPEGERVGPVFTLDGRVGRLGANEVSKNRLPIRRKPKRQQAVMKSGAAGTRTQDQRIKSPDEPEG